jgi:hypothetical protein
MQNASAWISGLVLTTGYSELGGSNLYCIAVLMQSLMVCSTLASIELTPVLTF